MRHLPLLLVVITCLATSIAKAQLPDGSTAPDWTHNDIFGNTHHLYELLDEGKMVVLNFSATWCGPCWNYTQTGALENFWEQYGPNGTDQAQVFYIESDQNTGINDLYGLTSGSQGNWVAAISFPIIDLQVGQNTDNAYQVNYYPTLFAVCADRTLYEIGQVPTGSWAEFIQSCTLEASVASIEESICFETGSVTLNVSGGVSPYTYDWSNGDHTPVLTGVSAGVYSCTVTEDNGKMAVIEDIVVTGVNEPVTLAESEIEPTLCFESSDGSVSVVLENAVTPISYEWSNGAQTQNLVNVPAGEYTLNATDDNGCPYEGTFVVTEPDELLAEYVVTPEYCDQADGTVTLDIEGGVGNYDISSSEGSVEGNQVVGIPAGTVTITVEDGNGCIWEEDMEIEEVPAPNLFFSPSPSISCIQPTTTVNGYVQNGSGDYEFSWSTTNGHIVGPTNLSFIMVDQPGDYVLLVNDLFSDCEAEDEVEVTSSISAPPVAAGEDTPISCEIPQLNLQGVGDPGYTVSWSTPDGNITAGGNTYTPTVNAPGLYIIEVVNPVNSCSNQDSVVVLNQINPAVAGFQYQTSSLTMIGTDVSTGSNLSGWLWTFGDGNSSSDPNTIHTYSSSGTYQVCLSVQNGCDTSQNCQSVEVLFTGIVLNVNAVIQNVLCFSDTTGSITIETSGGSGNYTYVWTGPGGETYNTSTLENVPAGTYQLVVSDDQGNLFIGEFIITEPTAVILAGSTVVDNLCFGQSNGSISIDITGGVGPYQFSFNGGPFQPENFIANQPGGDFLCMIQDANGCFIQAGPYTIHEPEDLGFLSTVTSVRCFGESNGAISLAVTGGVAPYIYNWNTGGNTTSEITQLPAGQYICLVTDHNGCTKEAVIDLTQPDLLHVNSVQVVDASNPQLDNGSITIEVLGGVSPYVISWSNGAIGATIQGLVPGEYTYQITDANGCTMGTSAPVVVNGTVATAELDWTSLISIVPNPSRGNVMIRWEELDIENGVMTLLTLDGRRLQSRDITSVTGQWDLSGLGLSSGVYIVLLEMKQQSVPFKLVIL